MWDFSKLIISENELSSLPEKIENRFYNLPYELQEKIWKIVYKLIIIEEIPKNGYFPYLRNEEKCYGFCCGRKWHNIKNYNIKKIKKFGGASYLDLYRYDDDYGDLIEEQGMGAYREGPYDYGYMLEYDDHYTDKKILGIPIWERIFVIYSSDLKKTYCDACVNNQENIYFLPDEEPVKDTGEEDYDYDYDDDYDYITDRLLNN